MTIGIDPGTSVVGVSLFAETTLVTSATLRSSAGKTTPERLIRLGEKVRSWLVDHDPDHAALVILELPGKQGGRNRSKALIGIGMGVGSMNMMLHGMGYSPTYCDVTEWSALAGGVKKSKEKRAYVLRSLFREYTGEGDSGLDEADAIGVAAYRLGIFNENKDEVQRLVREYDRTNASKVKHPKG